MDTSVIESISPLAADLRSENPDCYLATLFAPAAVRRSLIALYAVDNELARIQRVVNEPMAGLIRLQWWDEVIDGFERDKRVFHPVVAELKRAVAVDGLDINCLKRAIDGRRRPFEVDQPPDIVAFERYIKTVGGSIASAAAALLGITNPVSLAVAERVAVARVVLEQVSVVERADAARSLWLPLAWGNQNDGDQKVALEAETSSNRLIIHHLAELGLSELAKGRAEQVSIKRPQLSAFFPATLAGLRLRNRLREERLNTLSNGAAVLAWSWLRGRF